MKNPLITADTLQILKDLSLNNNREWFTEHKDEFKVQEQQAKRFFQEVLDRLNHHDSIERMKMFRIYRDVRFSTDKTPYKTHFAGSFSRMGAELRGGYYLCIKPGESFVAAGFWDPNKEDLHRIRKELEMDAEEFKTITSKPDFQKIWGNLVGEELKTAPKGFDKEHADIDLIRKKQYIFVRNFTDKQVLSPNFLDLVDESFAAIRPFFDLMSNVLTTNLNGESLLD